MSQTESTCESVTVRGLRYNVRHWGAADSPTLFLLHGWMDSSPTFQFLVDAFARDWHCIAPDWRGFGASEWLNHPYWYPDYYADLDVLLQRYSPDRPARLVGHSMGGNIAAMYAAIRPERVAQVAMLDFLGLKQAIDTDAAAQVAKWLDALHEPPHLSSYADHALLAQRLRMANPRLSEERASVLARTVSRPRPDGRIEMACDPWHKVMSPTLYRIDEVMTAWRKIDCPVLLVLADQGYVQQRFGDDSEELQRRIDCFSRGRLVTVADCGHNLHHDQPERLAAALEEFLGRD
jgi:pimeloyl-ACP methyl ester carboxylesterase